MPVYKYKTYQEAERALWNFNPDKAYFKKIHELFIMADKMNPVIYPKGIFKYKTLDEAQKQRQQWEIKNALKKQKKNEK